MGWGSIVIETGTIASAATLSQEFNLGKQWDKVYLIIPTMVSNTQFFIQASDVSGGTYRRITHPEINATVSQPYDFCLASATTNRIVPIPNGFQFMKIETSATVDSGATFKIICSDAG